MPADRICGHTLRYFAPDAQYDLYALLACFASSLCEWRFNLTSTNNHINAYEVNALPIPRFARSQVEAAKRSAVDWKRWEAVLGKKESDISAWGQAVTTEIKNSPPDGDTWPDSIHDALAVAGKEMSHLGEERQILTNDFAAWLIQLLNVDEESFTGMSVPERVPGYL